MAKKDFTKVNTGSVYASTIADATAEPAPQTIPRRKAGSAPTQAEIDLARQQGKTQGRAGIHSLRINMAFTPANHEFIKIMANASGKTMTQFTNLIIAAYRREHPEIMEQAQQFLNTINSGAFSSLLDGNGED